MFRELIRKNQQLSNEECIKILIEEKRGVLSVNGDNDYPYGMPMNHWYNKANGKIYFHCGNIGHRLDSLRKNAKVSFCVYDNGYQKENDWALNIKSVIVFGQIKILDDVDQIIDITRQLSYKFTLDDDYIENEIKNHLSRTLLLELTPENMCGKIVNES